MTDTTQDQASPPDPLGAVMEALEPLTDGQALRLLDAARARVVTLQPRLLDGPARADTAPVAPTAVVWEGPARAGWSEEGQAPVGHVCADVPYPPGTVMRIVRPLDAETAGQVMGPAGVAEVRDQWSGSVYEGAIVRLCDSHETLRALAGQHDPTGADHMAEMWAHAQRTDAAEARMAWLEGIEAAARTWRDTQRAVDVVLAGRPMDAAAYSAARPVRDAALKALHDALDTPPPAPADGQ